MKTSPSDNPNGAPLLVVEDDFANQRVASLFLKKLGFQADIAENGQVGLQLALDNSYQLIFMDCQMPVMDGFEACRQIREQNGPNQKTPIIALTANVMSGIQQECLDAGMDDVLNKPVQLEVMRTLIGNYLPLEK